MDVALAAGDEEPAATSLFGHELTATSNNEQTRATADSADAPAASPLSIDGLLNRIAERQHILAAMQDEVQQSKDALRSPSLLSRDLHIAQAVKDSDDPNAHSSRRRSVRRAESATPTRLTRLFAVHAPSSPPSSRAPSFTKPLHGRGRGTSSVDTLPLPVHLYTRGLLGGRHSDINVHVFGSDYALHRIVLDRAPFFASAFTEPWSEASSKSITLHPEELDPLITKTTFELALKRLYGCHDEVEEQREAIGLLATGCWLEMHDLVEDSTDNLLRTMCLRNLAPTINVVTFNYYGGAGERIYDSAKVMLTRDGSEMPLQYWDGIAGEVIRDVIGSDGFYVKGEWERWTLARRILNRRLRFLAEESNLVTPDGRVGTKAPAAMRRVSPRQNTPEMSNTSTPDIESDTRWAEVYYHPDIQSLLRLLDDGIYYSHLEFEHLQHIRAARDCFGVPIISEKTISDALWMNMELRQKILNAPEENPELGLKQDVVSCLEPLKQDDAGQLGITRGKRSVPLEMAAAEAQSLGQDQHNHRFIIPTADCNTFFGAYKDLRALSTSFGKASLSNSVMQQVRQHSFSGGKDSDQTARLNDAMNQPAGQASTTFPPFRFVAELPNHRVLKENNRSYSNVVFYAGSLWRFYVTKERSPSRSAQFGIYLQRARLKDLEEPTPLADKASVDERIGALEREMLLRREQRSPRQNRRRQSEASPDTILGNRGPAIYVDASAQSTPDTTTMVASQPDLLPATNPVMRSSRPRRFNGAGALNASTLSMFRASHASSSPASSASGSPSSSDSESRLDQAFHATQQQPQQHTHLTAPPSSAKPLLRRSSSQNSSSTTLPPYTDARATIKAYFKIYSLSRDGKSATVYESRPEEFKFNQGWGWKSSGLMALVEDQRWSGVDAEGDAAPLGPWPPHAAAAAPAGAGVDVTAAPGAGAAQAAEVVDALEAEAAAAESALVEEKRRLRERRKREKLRFTIVLGVV